MTLRASSGIGGFDDLTQGGFEQGSVSILVGAPGTGKTTFGLQFLYAGAVQHQEPGVLICFSENRDMLVEHSLEFGFDFEALEKQNLFRMIFIKPHQVSSLLQSGGGRVRDEIESIKAKRVVLDSLTAYTMLFRDDYLKYESTLEFFELLRSWGTTSLVISEDIPKTFEEKEGNLGFLADAIIHFYYPRLSSSDERHHCLEIFKMKGTNHYNRVVEVLFGLNGITVAKNPQLPLHKD